VETQQPESPESQASPAPEPGVPISESYRRYALGLLLVVYVFNFIDRQILSILLEPIKREIQLSDTQLGLLGGIAFAVFYTFAGIPIARWADRGSRRTIIALGLVVWSTMTALTGRATGFATLLLARIGVGVGEAACSPPAHSLISDYFPPSRRATALAIYSLGIPIGAALGNVGGGWLHEFLGWRAAFMAVGLPGIALALVVRLTLREPRRGHSEGLQVDGGAESVRDVIRFMARLPAFRHLSLACALHSFVGYGVGLFLPAFFIRSHGFGVGEIGSWLALLGLTGGVLGTYGGGWLADRLGVRDMRWYVWVPSLATLLGVPFGVLFYLWPEPYGALALAVPASILGPMFLGPSFAMTQALVKVRMRALAAAILLFVLNLIGLGLGPWFVGLLSDRLIGVYGGESLRYAMLYVVVAGNLWSALHYFLAARTLRTDLRARDA
jgi:predicted MFS family arabinose efflux permease